MLRWSFQALYKIGSHLPFTIITVKNLMRFLFTTRCYAERSIATASRRLFICDVGLRYHCSSLQTSTSRVYSKAIMPCNCQMACRISTQNLGQPLNNTPPATRPVNVWTRLKSARLFHSSGPASGNRNLVQTHCAAAFLVSSFYVYFFAHHHHHHHHFL